MEKWKKISGYNGDYLISNYGDVKSFKKFAQGKILKPNIVCGYCQIQLCKGRVKREYIHRLVAKAFIPNPENKPFINHKNGIKNHNYTSNLEWSTRKEIHKHAIMNGLINPFGESNPNSRLYPKEIGYIKKLKGRILQKEIAEIFNITEAHVSYIMNDKRWTHLNCL